MNKQFSMDLTQGMKKLLFLLLLLFGYNFFCINAQSKIDILVERQVVEYGYNDSVGLSLDYSNTICDTMFYDDKIILLESSPLLQLDEIRSLVNNGSNQSYDSIYNCARGFTATWKLEDKKLSLLSVHVCPNADKQMKKIMKLKKLKDISKRPVNADWVSGKITGGADAVKTNYGYAFKQEYKFEISKGSVDIETVSTFPMGSLEQEQALQKFVIKNSGALLDVYLHFDKFKEFRGNISRDNENGYLIDKICLIAAADGETYYAPSPTTKKYTLSSMSLDKSSSTRAMISHMNFANMLPKGSFYPRFLRSGVIYQPINIVFSWNIYGDIANVILQYYKVESKRRIPDGWIVVGQDEPR